MGYYETHSSARIPGITSKSTACLLGGGSSFLLTREQRMQLPPAHLQKKVCEYLTKDSLSSKTGINLLVIQ